MRIHSVSLRAPLVAALLLVAAGGLRLTSQMQQSAPADPHAALRANNLGAAYMNQQRMEQALAEFERASALDPKLTAARLNQGIALLNLQRIDPARAVLREVAGRDAKNIRAWYNLGLLEKNAGDAEAALAAFEKVAALDPADADTHYFIGALHAQQNRHPQAIAAFEQAIALNKFHVSAEFGLARALQRTGDTENARAHLARFQHLNTEKLGAPLSLAYGDQGPYSLAESVTLPPAAAPPPIPVKFTPVPASESGLDFVHPSEATSTHPLAAGACSIDFNGDGLVDLLFSGNARRGSVALYRNEGSGRFREVTKEFGLTTTGYGTSCGVGDYDNDGFPDLAIDLNEEIQLYRNLGGKNFVNVTKVAKIDQPGKAGAISFVDFDHDGDLDLFVHTNIHAPVNFLWRNNGNGEFADVTGAVGIPRLALALFAVATDFNNDRAIDLLVNGGSGASEGIGPIWGAALINPREGRFSVVHPGTDVLASWPWGAAVADFDSDGWMDWAFTHSTPFGLSLVKNKSGVAFQRVSMPSVDWDYGWGITPIDYDNDGLLDVAAVGEGKNSAEIRVFRNRGAVAFEDLSTQLGLNEIRLSRPRTLLSIDYDADGDTDLLIMQNGGPVILLRNEGGNKNNSLKLSLKGLADNKSAIGTKVEVFAGATYQKFEIQSSSGYLGQNAPDLLIGLGQEKQADVVRLLWPTGVLQDEVNLAPNQRHVITQIDRRGSSCPVLFAWNGSRFEFIADAIGPGIVGHWVAPGVRNTSDPTEYIKVPGSLLRERRGPNGERLLSFRFAEPMEEIVYLDQLRLFAIDHPSDTDVNPSERFYASGPPFPTGEPVFTRHRHARPPARAIDHRGRDVTALLRHRDRRYVADFADAPYKGFAELHWIELDLGVRELAPALPLARLAPPCDGGAASCAAPVSRNAGAHAGALLPAAPHAGGASAAPTNSATPLRLLLHGFTDYFTATSVYAAHQGGVTAIVPYVEAQLPDGSWQRIVDDMGFPAGLARTMVADLTGKLPPGTRRIRIATNLKVYWDQILIDTTPAATPHRITEAPLAAARAGYLGYPREIRGTPAADVRYDYHSVSATGPYARAAGHYTRYGDVRALVSAADDRFVLMGSGDEVAIDFDASALPPVPEGWTRDWFFYVDGFAKDMDFYAAHPFTVAPLPYHAMPGYPYPPEQPYPDRGAHLEDQLELNTRAVSGRPAPTYRYAYPK